MLTLLYKALILLLCSGCSVQPLYELKTENNVQSNIFVEVIAGKSGQILRGYLQDSIRDLDITNEEYTLAVDLKEQYTPYALTNEGYSQRLKTTLTANVTLKDSNNDEVIQLSLTESSSRNIANSQGDILLLMYDKANTLALKNLANRIVENLKVALRK